MPVIEPVSPGEALLHGALSPGPSGGKPAPLNDVKRKPAAGGADDDDDIPAGQSSPKVVQRKPAAADVDMGDDDDDDDGFGPKVQRKPAAKVEKDEDGVGAKAKRGNGTAAKIKQDKAAAVKAKVKSKVKQAVVRKKPAASQSGAMKKPAAASTDPDNGDGADSSDGGGDGEASVAASEADASRSIRDIAKARKWQSLWDSLDEAPDGLPADAVEMAKAILKKKHVRGNNTRQAMTELINNTFDKASGGKLVANTKKPFFEEAFKKTQSSMIDQWHEGIIECEAVLKAGSKYLLEKEVTECRVKKLGKDPNAVYFFPKITLSKRTTWATSPGGTRGKELTDNQFAAFVDGINVGSSTYASPQVELGNLTGALPPQPSLTAGSTAAPQQQLQMLLSLLQGGGVNHVGIPSLFPGASGNPGGMASGSDGAFGGTSGGVSVAAACRCSWTLAAVRRRRRRR